MLNGSASDRDLLLEENIGETDVFLALTNDDEANIMSSLLAKRLGASKVMTLINNPAYVDLVQGGEIDIAISPQLATIGTLLAHVRRGDIESVHSLRRGAAEAIEVVAHGDAKSSKVIGRSINDIKLPPGTTIGALVRDEEVLIAHGDTHIESGDHVLLFLVDKEIHPRRRATVPGRPDVLLRHALSRTAIGLRPTNTKGPRASFATAEAPCSVQSLAGAGHNGRHRWKRAG